MLLYLVRHGQTNWNVEGKLQGCSDIPLNEHGIMTAELTRDQLKQIPFTHAISSPLKRAMKTGEIIVGDRPIPVEPISDLMELSFGDYEGCCIIGEHKNIPDPQFQENFFNRPDRYITPPNGESLESVRRRANAFLQKLSQKKEWENDTILATAHGGIICAILAELHHYDMAHFWGDGVPSNCSVTIVRIENKTFHIEIENQVLWK